MCWICSQRPVWVLGFCVLPCRAVAVGPGVLGQFAESGDGKGEGIEVVAVVVGQPSSDRFVLALQP